MNDKELYKTLLDVIVSEAQRVYSSTPLKKSGAISIANDEIRDLLRQITYNEWDEIMKKLNRSEKNE